MVCRMERVERYFFDAGFLKVLFYTEYAHSPGQGHIKTKFRGQQGGVSIFFCGGRMEQMIQKAACYRFAVQIARTGLDVTGIIV